MLRRIFSDPTILLLLLSNLICIWYFQTHTDGFGTVVWIYWWQSVIIGIFNFLDLITIKNYDSSKLLVNGKPAQQSGKGCMSFFFLFHYGTFHLVYGVFLLVQQGLPNRTMLAINIIAFLMESVIVFRRKKAYEKEHPVNPGVLMFLPYLRILPMHLLILMPVFLSISPSLVFLILKTLADIIFYLITQKIYRNKSVSAY